MLTTILLGIVIAFFAGLGLRNLYRNFFQGESTCCASESGSCSCCSACGGAAKKEQMARE